MIHEVLLTCLSIKYLRTFFEFEMVSSLAQLLQLKLQVSIFIVAFQKEMHSLGILRYFGRGDIFRIKTRIRSQLKNALEN